MFNTLPYEPRKMSQLSWNALVVGKTCTASCRLWKKNATSRRFDENTGSEWEKCVSAYQCKRQTRIPEGRAFVVVRHIHTSLVWYDHAWIYFDKIAIPQYLCTPTTAHTHTQKRHTQLILCCAPFEWHTIPIHCFGSLERMCKPQYRRRIQLNPHTFHKRFSNMEYNVFIQLALLLTNVIAWCGYCASTRFSIYCDLLGFFFDEWLSLLNDGLCWSLPTIRRSDEFQ